MSVLWYLSYVALLVSFAFVTLSLASGLLWISELIEEHTRLAKLIGQRGTYVIILLHVILYFSEPLPLKLVAFSILCHLVYLQNFSSAWPLITLTSIPFVLSCVLVIADHFAWFSHFAKLSQSRHTSHRAYSGAVVNVPGFLEIATFFGTCVWLVPLFLFLSLSANDNALPQADPTSQSSMTFLRSLLRRGSSKRQTESLLPQRSPILRPVSPPHMGPIRGLSTSSLGSYELGPPRSPRASPALGFSVPSGLDLNTSPSPSRRTSSSLNVRRPTS
ncbi:transmembrane adaptor Erv26-domain-containing protein [Pterulicium gracile]|uniref:Transmembrane adaptor Erv26-domain-containing protein n=1 Tax=Pterulicium gracile TaxID=1884261 RepID=A0A5C3QUI3_9AGAR|nr:transmembrane adaptor Erv26-domain-containing protein [Pterula gracilis]